jgi:hypothetical protein
MAHRSVLRDSVSPAKAPSPDALLFTYRHLKVRIVMLSHELITAARIADIEETDVCVGGGGRQLQVK